MTIPWLVNRAEPLGELIDLNRQLDHPFLVNHTGEELVTSMSRMEATETSESQISINWHDKTKETKPEPFSKTAPPSTPYWQIQKTLN